MNNALKVAEDAAIVDVISNGRLRLGMGLGYRKEEFDAFGIDRRHRAGRMEEGLTIIRGALGDEPFSFSGRHYQLEGASVYPKPVQRPLPFWVGARSHARGAAGGAPRRPRCCWSTSEATPRRRTPPTTTASAPGAATPRTSACKA